VGAARGTWRGGPLYWGPLRICKGRLWKCPSLSIRGPLGNLKGGSFTGGFERRMKVGSGNGASPSLWELCEGNLEGCLLY